MNPSKAFSLVLLVGAVAGCRDGHSPSPPEVTPVLVKPGITFYLEDAEVRAREHPGSFFIPSAEERSSIQPGQIVKLIFVIETPDEVQAERMWVITKRLENGRYIGVLDNQPATTEAIAPGMEVAFEPRHVIAIHEQRASSP